MLLKVFPLAGFKRKTDSILFNKYIQKIRETIKLEFIREKHFVERKNEGRKPDKDSSLRRLKFMPENLNKKCR